MISYVLNMILHVILYYDIKCTFHMKYITTSHMISYVYDFTCI